ncbi:7241_t:CDS:2, partial [Racocetra fulgida]
MKDYPVNNLNKDNDKQKGPDVCFVEFTNDESKDNKEYLLVELVEEEQDIGDIRNLGKRKHDDYMVGKKSNKRGKSQKVLEVRPSEPSLSNQ